MKRTFIDQFFAHGERFAGIIINTGEDNYLTTADAYEAAHTVLASQMINEQFAYLSGLVPEADGPGPRVRRSTPTCPTASCGKWPTRSWCARCSPRPA